MKYPMRVVLRAHSGQLFRLPDGAGPLRELRPVQVRRGGGLGHPGLGGAGVRGGPAPRRGLVLAQHARLHQGADQ
eukprot:1179830-Prorocentrum_minimum.AAC.3